MRFKALVFDLDGTLVDSKIDFAAMKSELGLHGDDDVLSHIETLDHQARRHALAIIEKHERAGALSASPIDGALEFVRELELAVCPYAIFTRNAREIAVESLLAHGFKHTLLIAREDAPHKPKPDGLIKIATHLGLAPNEILFVGDYLYDLQAGLAAGVPTALYLAEEADFDTTGAHFMFAKFPQLSSFVFRSA